jgi:hypothetical protein
MTTRPKPFEFSAYPHVRLAGAAKTEPSLGSGRRRASFDFTTSHHFLLYIFLERASILPDIVSARSNDLPQWQLARR